MCAQTVFLHMGKNIHIPEIYVFKYTYTDVHLALSHRRMRLQLHLSDLFCTCAYASAEYIHRIYAIYAMCDLRMKAFSSARQELVATHTEASAVSWRQGQGGKSVGLGAEGLSAQLCEVLLSASPNCYLRLPGLAHV